jgi:bloom syndrome protein
MSSLVTALKTFFDYDQFRPHQEDVISNILDGNDALILMPTGAGKSICYQLPALCEDGLTVIVSPLLSLMFDQVMDLQNKGIIAHRYNSMSPIPMKKIFEDIHDGTCSLLYTTPETLTTNVDLQMELETLDSIGQLSRFVIDEAHCVSSWGHDFRSAYLGLHMRRWFPTVPICAFTATATKLVCNDIIKNLALKNTYISRSTFVKENIQYRVKEKEKDNWIYIGNSISKAIISLGYKNRSGIVYCLSRKECEYMAKFLCNRGISAEFYHAQIPVDKKEKVQLAWLKGEIKVIVATIAFALGINKPDVRYVIHTSMPKSVESYYQQAGRAGRDGKPCHCIMYYSKKDAIILQKMVSNDSTSKNLTPPVRNTDRINDIFRLCVNTKDCIKMQFSNYLGEYLVRKRCDSVNMCYNCRTEQGHGASEKRDVSKFVKLVLQQMPCDLQVLKRTSSPLEYRVICNLLNDGILITEIKDDNEYVDKVMDPEYPYLL